MSSPTPLPSVSHADYKRALRESKKKTDEDSIPPVKELPKIIRRSRPPPSSTSSTSTSKKVESNHFTGIKMADNNNKDNTQSVKKLPNAVKRKKKQQRPSSSSTSMRSSLKERIEKAESKHLARMSTATAVKKKRDSTTSSSNHQSLARKSADPTTTKQPRRISNNNKKQRIISKPSVEEQGFEVFNSSRNNDPSNDVQDDLVIEASFSEQQQEPDRSEEHQTMEVGHHSKEEPAQNSVGEDEGFEVFGTRAHRQLDDDDDELQQTNVIIEHTKSVESSTTIKQPTNKVKEQVGMIETYDLIVDEQPPSTNDDDKKDPDIQLLAMSLSFHTNDDSIFSKEESSPIKGSSQRDHVVIHTTTLLCDHDDPRGSPVRRTSSAIDMTGCIRHSVSPTESDESSWTYSSSGNNNVRQLEFNNSIHTTTAKQQDGTSKSKEEEEEVVSEQVQNDDNGWQDFGSSLTLLGKPVLSWFSATSDGVVISDDQDLSRQPSQEAHSTLLIANNEEKSSSNETVPNAKPNETKTKEEVAADIAIPTVDEKTSSASTLASSEASKKRLPTTSSSLSSTDGGSLSSNEIVGEVGASSPKVEISFPRQLSWFFSTKNNNSEDGSDFDNNNDGFSMNDWSQRTWNKVTTCIPSRKESPQRFYLFIFGICVITAIILCMILLMLNASSDMFAAGNNSTSSSPTDMPSMAPSDAPSLVPSKFPTNTPTITARPTISQAPSDTPSERPTGTPTISQAPSEAPSEYPSSKPSMGPSGNPTITAVPTSEPITYVPGKLTVKSNGLLLSEGLTSRVVARSGQKVLLTGLAFPTTNRDEWNNASSSSNPTSAPTIWTLESEEVFHFKPDGAAAYPWAENDNYNGKGWIYVSNAEVWDKGGGGVGALYFDDKGRVVDYKSLIKGTTANCSGGKTPWHSWVTCEEADDGRIFQVDPLGIRPPEEMTMGMGRGKWESFAYDIRDQSKPRFFATEDKDSGTLRRFTPDEPNWEDPWTMLQANGTVEFLVLEPFDSNTRTHGTFFWTTDLGVAKDNARRYFQHTEGIDIRGNQLFVVSKTQKELFILDLDAMTYEVHSTVFGLFDGQPDQMKRLISEDDKTGTKHDKSLLYFCEEGGRHNGVHARDSNGWYYTILESDELDGETSGLAFSPDGKHMYFSYQHRGMIFDVWREDGRPFHAQTLSIKYHETGKARSR